MAENGEEQIPKKVVSEPEELPKAIVRRVVKDKLSQISIDFDISVLRDSLQAFSESARIFIHYLSAAANDICKESNRQTINVEDVFKALEEIEFHDFIGPLRASLEVFRRNKSGSSKAKDTNKKLKQKEVPAESEGSDERREVINTGDKNKNPSSKAKDRSKKLKRKQPPAETESSNKRREVISTEEDNNNNNNNNPELTQNVEE